MSEGAPFHEQREPQSGGKREARLCEWRELSVVKREQREPQSGGEREARLCEWRELSCIKLRLSVSRRAAESAKRVFANGAS